MKDAKEQLLDAFRLGFRPPSNLHPADWASKNVSLMGSERSSKFDASQTPWVRDVMACAADYETREVVWLAPTGCGKSTMSEALFAWHICEDPGNILYASQTDSDAKFWYESRLEPALKSVKDMKDLWPKDRNRSRSCEVIFPHMSLVVGGQNESNFNEKSMRILYMDEAWRLKDPKLMDMFLRRHHDRWNRKVYIVSQAGWEEDALDVRWKKTDMADWQFRCPACGELAKYERKLLKYEKIETEEGQLDLQKTADTTRLQCPNCQAEYKDTDRERRRLTNTGEYVSAQEGLRGHRGFRVHRLAIWWIPWSQFTLKWLEAKRKLDLGDVTSFRQILQADECIPWADDVMVDRKAIKLSREAIKTRDPKALLDGETHRFFTLDKGGDHFWGVIRAWVQGERSELLWAGYIPMSSSSDDHHIKELQSKYAVQDFDVFVDIGFDRLETVAMCSRNGWIGIEGQGDKKSFPWGGGEEKPYSKLKIAEGSNGTRGQYVSLASDSIKDILWALMNGDGMEWTIPRDVPKAYHKHMRSEIKEEAEVGRRKELKKTWVTKSRQNHLWDAECYNVAVALFSGVFGD